MVPGAYHELTKEHNNHILFEAALKFMGEMLVIDPTSSKAPAVPFGQFNHEAVKYYEPRPTSKKAKFLLLLLAYVLIGLLLYLFRLRRKRQILTWPLHKFLASAKP